MLSLFSLLSLLGNLVARDKRSTIVTARAIRKSIIFACIEVMVVSIIKINLPLLHFLAR